MAPNRADLDGEAICKARHQVVFTKTDSNVASGSNADIMPHIKALELTANPLRGLSAAELGRWANFESILGRIKTMSKLSDSMREFLNGRHYATLATLNEDGSIHLTPVWYLFEDERFFISTSSSGRKVRNILSRPQASILVDSRRRQGDERWVSTSGTAEIIHGARSEEIYAKILKRYVTKAGLEDPTVGPIFTAAGEVIISLKPDSWRSWELKSLDDQYFGGVLRQAPEKWFFPID